MDISRRVRVPGSRERLFAHVDDLGRYPVWMDLVHEVEPVPIVGDEGAAWMVELRAKVGPLARSKRLRMVRTQLVSPTLAVFERRETDGRTHAPWILRAEVAAVDDHDAELTMNLHYGGSLWTGAVLERVLDSHVERGSRRLRELLTAPPTP
jgi:hypothetical protein